MTEKVFKNLGKFISYEEKIIKAGMPVKIMISYTQPNYQDPSKVWNMGVFEDKISEELLEKIDKLKKDELICVHTEKNDAGYSDLTDVSDAKDVPQKAVGGAWAKKGGGGGWNSKPKDDTGITVGAAWTNAMDFYKVTSTKPAALSEVADLVSEIITLKKAQEDKLRASTTKAAAVKADKPLTAMEKMKAKKAANQVAVKSKPVADVKASAETGAGLEDDELSKLDF